MKKGIFCLSFDIDLLWGRHDLHYKPFIKPLKKARPTLKEILSFLEKNEMPATWGIIGHLYLQSCKPKRGTHHPEIIRPNYPWYKKDWFYNDPSSNINKAPLWYANDIVDLLKKSRYQEIACHSFSHIIFGHPGCSPETAESEVKECTRLAKKRGIKLKSFIFPRNKIGYLDILKKYGFLSFRGAQPNFESLPKILQFLQLVSPTPPPTYSPKREQGLINIPASFYFLSARGIRKFIPPQIIINKIKRGIDSAIENGSIFHLWTHLEDFAENYKVKMKIFREILDYAIQKQKEGVLTVKSMGQIAENSSNFLRIEK